MPVKPGVKTTEFWATALFNLAIFISTFTSSLPGKDQLYAALVINGLYVASRTVVKFKSIPKLSSIVPLLEQLLADELNKGATPVAAAAKAPSTPKVTPVGTT